MRGFLIFLLIYILVNCVVSIMSAIIATFDICDEEVKIVSYKTIYNASRLNLPTCMIISAVVNILFPAYNLGIYFVAGVYYITHVGRDDE